MLEDGEHLWWDVHYPNGAKVIALDPGNRWEGGEIICRTADMQARVDGIRVRFDGGGYCDYDLGYLTEDGSPGQSLVQVIHGQ